MTRLALPLLLGLAGVLAATTALEFLVAGPEDGLADATGIRPLPRVPHVDTTRESAETVDHTGAWVATILGRPLFTRDRRPADAPKVSGGPGMSEGPLPRLTGVAVTPVGRLAIFAGSDSAKPLVVGEGGMVAGYRVKAILPGAVRIEGRNGERTIATSFDPNPRAPQTDNGPQQFAQPGQPQFPQPGQPQFPQPGQPFPQGVPGQFAPGFPRVPGLQFQGRARNSDGAELSPHSWSAPRLLAGRHLPGSPHPTMDTGASPASEFA